mgnify:CR=1 FL=1
MIKIGIIGTGGMARAHAKAYQAQKDVEIIACCDILEVRAKEFAEQFKIKTWYTDYKKMLANEKLTGISVASTDATHAEISIEALKKKVAVLCEKPMAVTVPEAHKMIAAAKKAGVITMINFSKRDSSAIQYAKKYIEDGKIGKIMHVDAQYLQSWLATKQWGDWRTNSAWLWRLSTKHGSGGVLADIGCHIYDMASFLCGDISEIYSEMKTFPKAKGNKIGEYILDANDSFVSTVSFKNGALGTVHCSRWATGYINREFICVYGDQGAIEIDFNKGQKIVRRYDMALDVWETVGCPKTPSNYERFIIALKTGKKDASDFTNGIKIQKYLEATFTSAKNRKPIKIK